MNCHDDNSDVQYVGILFLLKLAQDNDSMDYLLKNDVDDVILRAQAKHTSRAAIQKGCIEMFWLICDPLLSFYSRNHRKFILYVICIRCFVQVICMTM